MASFTSSPYFDNTYNLYNCLYCNAISMYKMITLTLVNTTISMNRQGHHITYPPCQYQKCLLVKFLTAEVIQQWRLMQKQKKVSLALVNFFSLTIRVFSKTRGRGIPPAYNDAITRLLLHSKHNLAISLTPRPLLLYYFFLLQFLETTLHNVYKLFENVMQ